MDLQAAHTSSRRWPLAKIAALVCFATACGFLIGSLAQPAKARLGNAGSTGIDQIGFASAVSPRR
jgi:hypothetical protein